MTTPTVLELQGRLDHDTIERAVDAVNDGLCPGWNVVYDEIGMEILRGQGRAPVGWSQLGGIVEGLGPTGTASPERVWVIVLEESATARREVVKFLLVGGSDEQPEWVRIRADASTPA